MQKIETSIKSAQTITSGTVRFPNNSTWCEFHTIFLFFCNRVTNLCNLLYYK